MMVRTRTVLAALLVVGFAALNGSVLPWGP